MKRATVEYRKTPAAFRDEKRDCAVRALRIAANVSYESAHKTLASFGRMRKHGTYIGTMAMAAARFNLLKVHQPASGSGVENATVAQFLRAHRSGRYVLYRNRHFFAIVNGVVHDYRHGTGARSRIKRAWGSAP